MTAILMTPEGEITLPAEVREKFGLMNGRYCPWSTWATGPS